MVRTSKNNIEKCLNLLLDEKILINFLDSNSEKLIESIYDNWSEIKELWLKKQHYTFGRVICNLRLIPSFTIENHIWDINLYNWLIENEYIDEKEIFVCNKEGLYGRQHVMYIKNNKVYFDTAGEEYEIGYVDLDLLLVKIGEYNLSKVE